MGGETILDRILAAKAEEVARHKRQVPQGELEERARQAPAARPFAEALRGERVAVIAEVKRASPSKGILAPDFDPVGTAGAYARGGAAAVSVLTDEPFFGGSLEFLPRVREVFPGPLLRKDFITDPYQVVEARAWGADALLLIASVLDRPRLADLLALTREWGMEALVEVHTAEEVERSLAAGARVVGVNNRDLRTFYTDLAVTEKLAVLVPEDVILVSESGIGSRADVERVARAGIDAVLVGESLMRQGDPEGLLREMAQVVRQTSRSPVPGGRQGA